MSNRKPTGPTAAFMNWARSAAMWVIWNVPIGNFAPALMGYALQRKPALKGLNGSKAR